MENYASSDIPIEGESRKQKPEWLERFLKRTFFDPCSEHPSGRNELNKYCIDCDKAFCQFCLSLAPHDDHRLLKIYRHVYKDVVLLDEFERHIDCSNIQPYRCNKQLVIAASPLPHSGSKTIDDEGACQTCKRKLMQSNLYNYCSISCKVEAFSKKEDADSPPFLSLDGAEPKIRTVTDEPLPSSEQEGELKKRSIHELLHDANQAPELESELKMTTVDQAVQNANKEPVNKRTHRRKGIPHRAPFF